MAVQKSRCSRSRRDIRRAQKKIKNPELMCDTQSNETHKRHHVTRTGYYKGHKVFDRLW